MHWIWHVFLSSHCRQVLEHLFVAIFLLELAWRIYSERLRYFKELMNVFDSILVLIACIDLYILTPLIQTSLNNTATLRLLRTIKLAWCLAGLN